MKKINIIAAVLLFIQFDSHADVNSNEFEDISGIYGKVDVGFSAPTRSSYKPNAVYSLGIGYHLNDLFRTDLTLQYRDIKDKRNNNLKKNIDSYAAFLNGYLNLSDSRDNVIPYLSGGIGYSVNKLKSSSKNNITLQGRGTNNFIWNLGAGLAIKIYKSVYLDLSYRYVNLGNTKGQVVIANGIPGPIKIKSFRTNEVTGGIIFNF
jgi:opacity protein-like surface antigen